MPATFYLLYTELSLSLIGMLGGVVAVFAGYVLYQYLRGNPLRVKERELRAQHKREMAELEHRHLMRQQDQYNRIALARERMTASVTIFNEAAAHLTKIDHTLQQRKGDTSEALESLREIARVTAYRLAVIGSESQEEAEPDVEADPTPRYKPTPITQSDFADVADATDAATLAPAAPFAAAADS